MDKLLGRREQIDWEQLRRVVLRRDDAYEGFERESFGDEVPQDVAERGRELLAADDIDGVRELLIDLSRQGNDNYDYVALGDQRGGWWEFRGFDVADKKGKSALLHRSLHDLDDRLSPHGLFWNHEDAQAFMQAAKGVAIVPVFRFRRSGLAAGQSVWYSIGNEHNPGNPFGRIELIIDEDNHAKLELHFVGASSEWTGDVAPGLTDEIKAAFARGGFPHRPRHMLPAGATVREVELVVDDKPDYLMIYDRLGMEVDGYKDGFAMLEAIAVQLSEGAYKGGEDSLPPSVSNIQRTR
ncbi:hypothetical protein [Solirubrobacter deserti]|uniref:Uncharacterized protein n=1 Tax=Solirubrobacter deserti TaxID=2282478 RepID=A0ABT4RTZ3_9ACTN|nr:hypothetical protein [Solirubrobacter deserti]MDA0142046.1 hypothetical protein [Solirubrobacter deserti]